MGLHIIVSGSASLLHCLLWKGSRTRAQSSELETISILKPLFEIRLWEYVKQYAWLVIWEIEDFHKKKMINQQWKEHTLAEQIIDK